VADSKFKSMRNTLCKLQTNLKPAYLQTIPSCIISGTSLLSTKKITKIMTLGDAEVMKICKKNMQTRKSALYKENALWTYAFFLDNQFGHWQSYGKITSFSVFESSTHF
jgi:hypothetical protein